MIKEQGLSHRQKYLSDCRQSGHKSQQHLFWHFDRHASSSSKDIQIGVCPIGWKKVVQTTRRKAFKKKG